MPAPLTVELLSRLVAFDTTSRNTNLPLIDYAEDWLRQHGARTERVADAGGAKASLWATMGPEGVPGIVLSGHTDVVPVDGQSWRSDPFTLSTRDGRYYGRGACDMKGFLAACLALAPQLGARPLAKPIHFALSYDEEVGCVGVRPLLAMLAERGLRAEACIVGEPTDMTVVIGHKGKRSFRATVRGRSGHSSRAPELVNAVEQGARLVDEIRRIGLRLAQSGLRDDLYDVVHSTAHVGIFHGGTALNIVPDSATVDFEFRLLPEEDADAIIEGLRRHIGEVIEPDIKAVAPDCGIDLELRSAFPGLATPADTAVVALAKRLTGRNDHGKVAYGTEAGLFVTMAGIPTVVCGPGSIVQAHQADEFVTAEQLDKCEAFLQRLAAYCAAG